MKKINKFKLLINDQWAQELDKEVVLRVTTNCPEKWRLTDLETGEVYVGSMPSEDGKEVLSWRKD